MEQMILKHILMERKNEVQLQVIIHLHSLLLIVLAEIPEVVMVLLIRDKCPILEFMQLRSQPTMY